MTDDVRRRGLSPRNVVLIAGTGRSGTTWLGKILDSSPGVFYKSQPDDVTRYPWFRGIPSRIDPTPENDGYCGPFARAVHDTFWHHSAHLAGRPDFPKAFLHNGAWWTLNLGLRAWRRVTRGGAPIVPIPRAMFRSDPYGAKLVIKSVVSNMRLAWIHWHFPDIKIILIIRHPAGYLNSIFKGSRDHNWVNVGKKERLAPTLLPFPLPGHERYAKAFEKGDDFERELIYWLVANETPCVALRDCGMMKTVVYEELCIRPHDIVRETFGFLELPYTKQTACFLDASTCREHRGYYSVYKNPINSAFKWQKELRADAITVVDNYLDTTPLLRALFPTEQSRNAAERKPCSL